MPRLLECAELQARINKAGAIIPFWLGVAAESQLEAKSTGQSTTSATTALLEAMINRCRCRAHLRIEFNLNSFARSLGQPAHRHATFSEI